MTTEIKVPALGEGVESGDVLEVFVSEGDAITKDQGILELETDKATVTIPAPAAGKVIKLLVQTGETIKVGQVIATLESSEAGAPPNPPAAERPAARAEKTPEGQKEQARAADLGTPKKAAVADSVQQSVPQVEAAPMAAAGAVPAREVGSRVGNPSTLAQVPAGPAMRRFAREVGIDLRAVVPSGEHGRVTREDILAVVRRGGARATPEASSGTGEADQYGPIRLEKIPKIRATIAHKMHESWTTVARVTNFDDADVTELEQVRQSNKKEYESRGIKLTALPFLVKAVAMALKNHPIINASLDLENNHIIYKEYVNIGIAVDTERGLVVPNLRNADKLAIPDIARALAQMAENVRQGQFSVDDLRGGTFTISNLGAIGGTYSTPIVNVPETAILLAGRSRKMPVVKDDEVVVRLMMPLSISYDHRLIDGAAAARFLNDVIAFLESPNRLFLAL